MGPGKGATLTPSSCVTPCNNAGIWCGSGPCDTARKSVVAGCVVCGGASDACSVLVVAVLLEVSAEAALSGERVSVLDWTSAHACPKRT